MPADVQLSKPGPAPVRWRARRWRRGHGCAAGRGNPPLRTAGDAVRRRARALTAILSGPRHPLVDGALRRLESALRSDRGPRARPAIAVAAARRDERTFHAGSEQLVRRRRRDRRQAGSGTRWLRALLGRSCQSSGPGGPQAGTPARYLRRMGTRPSGRHRGRSGRTFRPDTHAVTLETITRPAQRRNTHDPVGHRLPSGLWLAAGPGGDAQGRPAPRWRRRDRSTWNVRPR